MVNINKLLLRYDEEDRLSLLKNYIITSNQLEWLKNEDGIEYFH